MTLTYSLAASRAAALSRTLLSAVGAPPVTVVTAVCLMLSNGVALAAGTSPDDPINFDVDGGVQPLSLTGSDQEAWLRVIPPVTVHATHFDLQTAGALDTELEVFANYADAVAGDALVNDDDSGTGLNALVRVPIGFVGPYYVRVSSYWMTGSTSLSGSLALAPTARCNWPSGCSLATAAQAQPDASRVLRTLRSVNRELLSLSAAGRALSSLYWRVSVDLVPALALDRAFRAELFGHVRSLIPLAHAALAAASGETDTVRLEAHDIARMAALLELVSPHLSADNSAALIAAWRSFGLDARVGVALREVLALHGLLPERGKKVTLLFKVRSASALDFATKRTGVSSIDRLLAAPEVTALRSVHPDTPQHRAAGLATTLALDVLGVDRAAAVRDKLATTPEVEWVEESGELHVLASTSDPYSSQLWGLDAIRAPQAWPLTRGRCETLVAVVDTGIRADLFDLHTNLLPEKGHDFANDDADPDDRHGHGTHVTGTLAASADNSASIAGVAPGVCFFAVKVLSDSGSGTFEDVAAGIRHAADQGAKVVNISAGCDCYSQAVEDSLAYAVGQRDAVVIAAAGNDGIEGVFYPASSPWALAVGAVDRSLDLASFSNWGPEIDLVAPGVDIVSTFRDGESCLGSGTSMASPHVAGVAALLRSLHPSKDRAAISSTLFEGARDRGPAGWDSRYGHGLVDALSTLQGSATISISGPILGPALTGFEFSASATGCEPGSNAWAWSSSDFYVLGEGNHSSVVAGWVQTGGHRLTARNSSCLGAEGALTVEVQQPSGQSFELISADSIISPERPTVVFTHGFQATDRVDRRSLWTCVTEDCGGSVEHSVGELLRGHTEMNRLQFTWSGAAGDFPTPAAFLRAAVAAPAAGLELGRLLSSRLGAGYSKGIHFVGHSLGTAVSSYAAAQFLPTTAPGSYAQLTALDRPDPLGFGPDFFPMVLTGALRSDLGFELDNYWSSTGFGVGSRTRGIPHAKVYNHYRPMPDSAACPGCGVLYAGGLTSPNDVGDAYFANEGGSNDHTGVQQWFRWSMNPNAVSVDSCSGPSAAHWNMPLLFDGSLNPCNNGWYWSLFGPSPSDFPAQTQPDTPAVVEQDVPSSTTSYEDGLESRNVTDYVPSASLLRGASTQVDIPLGTRGLRFALTARNIAASDFVAVLLDSSLVWSGQASVLAANTPVSVGPVPIEELSGSRQLRVQVAGTGSTQVELSGLRAVRMIPTCALPSTLCVTNHRFRVEAEWEDHQQHRGDAAPRTVAANDSGFFWFFDETNVELVIKVLDGCGVNQRFWVFAAGMTDVGVRLRVTDTWTGESRTYENPRGTPFQPIQDTTAFASCGASRVIVEPGTGVLRSPEAEHLAMARPESPELTDAEGDIDGSIAGGVSGKTLFLNGNRFAVTTTWRTADGSSGEGTPVALSGDSGYFWFFNAGNIELVLKVLDGCGLNQRFWVFAGGLTDVQVTITVRDTGTGRIRTYSNPLGSQFQPITDTNGFATCP